MRSIMQKYHGFFHNKLKTLSLSLLLFSMIIMSSCLWAQEKQIIAAERDTMLAIAREMMAVTQYCALITMDQMKRPQVRTMNPYTPDKDMVIWFATNRKSRKVKEIKNNPHVCLYYADHTNASGYVSITGSAEIIDDKKVLEEKKRKYWEASIDNWREVLVLIKITPEKLDILNYKHGLTGDSVTWRTPSIEVKID